MAYLLAVPLEHSSNEVLVLEVDQGEVPGDLVLASRDSGAALDRARVSLEEALAKLKPSLYKVIRTFKDLSPEEMQVEFGLKIGGETGVIVAKGTAEVNFIVRMTWKSH